VRAENSSDQEKQASTDIVAAAEGSRLDYQAAGRIDVA